MSPLVLHSVAVVGTTSGDVIRPTALAGLSLSPKKTLTVPASGEVVERLGLKNGVRIVAARLTGL